MVETQLIRPKHGGAPNTSQEVTGVSVADPGSEKRGGARGIGPWGLAPKIFSEILANLGFFSKVFAEK